MFTADWTKIGTIAKLRNYVSDPSLRPGWNENDTDTIYIEACYSPKNQDKKDPSEPTYVMYVWNDPSVRERLAVTLGRRVYRRARVVMPKKRKKK